MDDPGEVLDRFIALERKSALLYRFFRYRFPEDAPFWWQLAREEDRHALLLRTQRDPFRLGAELPEPLLRVAGAELDKTLVAIDAFIAAQSALPFSRHSALTTALHLENLSGEREFHHLLARGAAGSSAAIFRRLCNEERDHACRIADYLHRQGLTE